MRLCEYQLFEVPALTYKTGDSDATEDPSQLRVMRHSASAHSYAVWRVTPTREKWRGRDQPWLNGGTCLNQTINKYFLNQTKPKPSIFYAETYMDMVKYKYFKPVRNEMHAIDDFQSSWAPYPTTPNPKYLSGWVTWVMKDCVRARLNDWPRNGIMSRAWPGRGTWPA